MRLMNYRYLFCLLLTVFLFAADAVAQVDRRDVRRGNRDFKKEEYREAELDYMKALVKDSTSVAANYNIASAYYRLNNVEQAQKALDRVKDTAPMTASAADYNYNRGDVARAMKDDQTAVEAFAKALILRPDDLDAKDNFIISFNSKRAYSTALISSPYIKEGTYVMYSGAKLENSDANGFSYGGRLTGATKIADVQVTE